MDTVTINDISQDQHDTAERIIVDLIRARYPKLDLRAGSVLRETLVRPAATAMALDTARAEKLRSVTSLARMIADGTASDDDINAVLANYSVNRTGGTYATGYVKVRVDGARGYTIGAGTRFSALSGLAYAVQNTITARVDPDENELQLHHISGTSYYFLLPVRAVAVGGAYNIAGGTVLTCAASLYGYVDSEAYSNFSGGTDGETVAQAVSRIPAALSHRGLTSRTAIEAQLRARFEGTDTRIRAVSVQGFGDAAMPRDKHNVFGVAVGGRADIYVRTFADPAVLTLIKTGTRIGIGTYSFTINAAEAPGFILVRGITDAEGLAVASYAFDEARTAEGLAATWHDINASETVNTVFQQAQIIVYGVPGAEAEHTFKVELYAAPGLKDLQDYVDDDSVRNVTADLIVRSPLVCRVSVSANVYYPMADPVDIEGLKVLLSTYVNSRGFRPRLTRSELTQILLTAGVSRVDLGQQGLQLQGTVRDAAGVTHMLSGDSLDLAAAAVPSALFTENTCVFTIEPQHINLNGIPE